MQSCTNFNPCSPCGERHAETIGALYSSLIFQSMLPMRGASSFEDAERSYYISIHAPHAGSVSILIRDQIPYSLISIHAPHAGSVDPSQPPGPKNNRNFNPCSPCGERPNLSGLFAMKWTYFNPCSPCGERRQNYTNSAYTFCATLCNPPVFAHHVRIIILIFSLFTTENPALTYRYFCERYRLASTLHHHDPFRII